MLVVHHYLRSHHRHINLLMPVLNLCGMASKVRKVAVVSILTIFTGPVLPYNESLDAVRSSFNSISFTSEGGDNYYCSKIII